ncbi:MAG: hypothetical protein KDC88_12090, partial [Ignavibacteriae bacterium]|nr:hypothetical protein [Ignavibacteriota bacterium]
MNYLKMNICIALIIFFASNLLYSQKDISTHTRGKLWETLSNMGYIGSLGAWDYGQVTGVGFYPGFPQYYFPNHEEKANDPSKITNANFHNFRSGPIIMAKDPLTLLPPDFTAKPIDYLLYHASLVGQNGVIFNYMPWEKTNNHIEKEDFNPLLPEEINYTSFPTSTGIKVKQRSMQWGFPDYDDFIIYDYTFINTGEQVITALNEVRDLQQTLEEVWIAFHSGISVSTKGTLNFYYNPNVFIESSAPAGGFGGYHNPGSDIYSINNLENDGEGLYYYSRDFNGGKEPLSWTGYSVKPNWENLLKLKPDWDPELQDPACFGFAFLYATPPVTSPNQNPLEADPTHFSVYNDEGNSFNGRSLDFN